MDVTWHPLLSFPLPFALTPSPLVLLMTAGKRKPKSQPGLTLSQSLKLNVSELLWGFLHMERQKIPEERGSSRAEKWWRRSASLCSILNFRMQTSAQQPPIRTPKFDQHLIKWSGGEGIGSITHNAKAVVILDCIEMRSRQLCWFYICGVLCICTSCTVCPAGLYRCLTHTPSIFIFNPQTPVSCARCWEVRAGPTGPQDFSQFSLLVLLLCIYAIHWLVKCYLLHKVTAKTSAYVIWWRKWGKKLLEQLINLIYLHFLGSFPPVFMVIFSGQGTAVSVPTNSLRKRIIIRNLLERKWVRAKAWELNLLNLVKNELLWLGNTARRAGEEHFFFFCPFLFCSVFMHGDFQKVCSVNIWEKWTTLQQCIAAGTWSFRFLWLSL